MNVHEFSIQTKVYFQIYEVTPAWAESGQNSMCTPEWGDEIMMTKG